MKVYNYDKTTKEFVGESPAFDSPLEPGVYLIPSNATTVPVANAVAGTVAIFDELAQTWTLVDDNRGIVYNTITNEEFTYHELGELPKTLTKKQKPSGPFKWENGEWILDEEVASEAKKKTIKEEKVLKIEKIIVTTSTGKSFDGDEQSQSRMARVLATDSDNVKWKLADNTIVEITREELQEALKLATVMQANIWLS